MQCQKGKSVHTDGLELAALSFDWRLLLTIKVVKSMRVCLSARHEEIEI